MLRFIECSFPSQVKNITTRYSKFTLLASMKCRQMSDTLADVVEKLCLKTHRIPHFFFVNALFVKIASPP